MDSGPPVPHREGVTSRVDDDTAGSAHQDTRAAWLGLAVVAGALFLAVLSTTVVSVALPTIGTDLPAGPTDLQWIVDAYVLVYASLMVAGGVIGDRYGRKGVLIFGVIAFGAGSLIAGLAPTVELLIVGRLVQGLGPALLVPGGLTVITTLFTDPAKRATAIGLWSTSAGLGMAVGPGLGGLIVNAGGWRWVFWYNVPLAIGLLVAAALFVPRLATIPARGRFDWFGGVLATAGVAGLVFAVIEGQTRGWASALVIAAFAVGAAAIVGFVLWERRLAEPLIDVSLFVRPAFAAAGCAAFVVFFAFVGAIVYFSAYFQQVQGLSPVSAGLYVSIIGLALGLAAAVCGPLLRYVSARTLMVVGLLVAGTATLGLLRLDVHTGIGSIWWNFALLGVGIGICNTPTSMTAMAAVEVRDAGMASAVFNAVRQVGQVFGVAVLGALVYAPVAGAPDGEVGPRFVEGLHNALWLSAAALLAMAVLAAVLLSGRRRPGSAG